ncbi:MAG TPA: OmpA family protein, partial [Bacteroidales bacterium]|nr:OmpA family protein [Bacteroidales bacterium]
RNNHTFERTFNHLTVYIMKIKFFFPALLFMLCICVFTATAQIDVKQKVKDKSIDRADQRTDEGVDEGLDAVEDGVKSLFKKKEKKPKAEQEENTDQEENGDDSESKQVKKNTPTPKPVQEPTLQSATKYDFVPGDKVILFEDFSQDEIGDFPALWTTNGSGEVRTLNLYPGKWFYMNAADKIYALMKDMPLPDNFIFEFDVVPTGAEDDPDNSSFYLTLFGGSGEYMNDELYPGEGFHITCSNTGWEVTGYREGAGEVVSGNSELAPIEVNKLNHVIVWVQKRRVRIYHKGQKVVDMPTIIYDGTKFNRLRYSLWSQRGLPYISNIRFTTAKPDIRSKLLTEGKIVSYGIYFDVNSDKVKAESYGTLKEIAQVLTENPGVRIKIVGHTDSDGDAAKNLDLSKRRAAAVKSELSKTFNIDAGRIETDGKGKTEPIAPNDTPANKAQNRRVEFIKL